MPVVDPNRLVGRSLLLDKEGGQLTRDRIIKAVDDFKGNLAQDSSRLKFFCTMNNDII